MIERTLIFRQLFVIFFAIRAINQSKNNKEMPQIDVIFTLKVKQEYDLKARE